MYSLFKKEIIGFLGSITGYIVIIVFLIANSLFMFIIPGQFNIFDSGYASIDTLFVLAPWIFLFLVPAITMRLFAEEKRTGTIEFILTKPIPEFQIILAKYFAGLALVLFALLPTLLFFYSVYLLGNPVGSIDTGGTWGSYIGLFFLAAIYVAIGVFSSSLTDNQIVAFIISVALSFILFIGFETVSNIELFKNIENFIIALGINEHYRSMSRGVLDTRDILYFLSAIVLFLLFTKTALESRKW